jgi:hypothetical protein
MKRTVSEELTSKLPQSTDKVRVDWLMTVTDPVVISALPERIAGAKGAEMDSLALSKAAATRNTLGILNFFIGVLLKLAL